MSISEKVKVILEAENIAVEELQRMVYSSAISAHGHRRYFQWLFKIEGDEVVSMELDTVIDGDGEDLQYSDCEKCEGIGCKQCGWSGISKHRITDTTRKKLEKAYASW